LAEPATRGPAHDVSLSKQLAMHWAYARSGWVTPSDEDASAWVKHSAVITAHAGSTLGGRQNFNSAPAHRRRTVASMRNQSLVPPFRC
jgi:hypothetical protein